MIDVLLASYNGETYLEQQLDSIINQTYCDWNLIISDDCSFDNTKNILNKYKNKFPKKISLYFSDTPSGSAKYNFYRLMSLAHNDYVMFCDQDDVWLKNKIEKTFDVMRRAELHYGKDCPILVHSDLYVVNQNLELLGESLFRMQRMDCKRDKLNNLLVSNIVTGCTVMLNKALLELCKERPDSFVMHDMWVALVASAFGHIIFIDEPLILYRQHEKNSVGAKDESSIFKSLFNKAINYNKVRQNQFLQYKQAAEFLRIFESSLNDNQKETLYYYSNYNDYNFFKRLYVLKKYKLFKNNLLKAAFQLII